MASIHPIAAGPRLALAAGLAVTPVTALAQACDVVQVQKLLASDANLEDRFGGPGSLQIEGDRITVGARYHLEGGVETGAAYVFEFDGTDWVETQQLVSSDADEGDRFGGWNAMSGDTIISGATGDTEFGLSTGAAYVFQYDGTSWVETQKLLASDASDEDFFGRMVTMEGTTAVIGAWTADTVVEPSAGAVYIFEYDGTSWIETQKLYASDGLYGEGFGSWMSIEGDRLAIGSSHGVGNESNTGAVYMFEHDGTSWVEVQKIIASDGASGDIFGHAVGLSGDRLVVGAAYSNFVQGAAYVFEYDGTSWVETAKLTASDGEPADVFGYCDIAGDSIIIGGRWDDDNGDHAGAVYHFRYDGTEWIEAEKFVSDDIEEGDSFGWSLAIEDETILVGARNDDDFGNGTGSAYVFSLNCSTPCLADINGDGMLSPTDFTAWVGAFNTSSAECDQNGDGSCTPTDFTAWISNFNAGC